MTGPQGLQAVLFDLGGTLFEHQSTSQAHDNLMWAAREMGIAADPPTVADTFVAVRRHVETDFAGQSFYRHRELVAEAIRQLAHHHGARPREDVIQAYCDRQRRDVTAHLRPRADCAATLAALHARGRRLAIVSNIDDDYLEPIVSRTGLRRWFDVILSSETAASCKPDRAIFDQALDRLGIGAAHALFVGDSVRHDVHGARRAGMRTVLIGDDADPVPTAGGYAEPDYRIQNLSELVPLVDGPAP